MVSTRINLFIIKIKVIIYTGQRKTNYWSDFCDSKGIRNNLPVNSPNADIAANFLHH